MTVSQSFLNSIYTSKDGALTAYQIGKLEILKPCLLRLNKISENGISITVCDSASTEFTSKVSKSAAEKGVKSVVVAAGDGLLFAINAQSKKDGAPSEEAGLIESLGKLLKLKGIQEGEIFLATCDLGMIPPKGLDAETLEFLAKKKDSNILNAWKFASPDELTTLCNEQGLTPKIWIERYEQLNGDVFKEMSGGYSKKSFVDTIEERIVYLEKISKDEKWRIIKALGYAPEVGSEDFGLVWTEVATKLLTSF